MQNGAFPLDAGLTNVGGVTAGNPTQAPMPVGSLLNGLAEAPLIGYVWILDIVIPFLLHFLLVFIIVIFQVHGSATHSG